MLDALHSTRLIFVTGKGGVGKSTAAAALGQALAKQGRRCLVIETDTYSALADLLTLALADGQIHQVTGVPGLSVQNLMSEDALVHIIRQFVPSERVSRSVIQNRVARVFFKAAPSVNEFSILNRVLAYYQQSERNTPVYDHILVDLPASGHAVTYLNVPQTLHGMMRGIGKFATLASDIDTLVRDPKRCAIVAVCLPEEMPVNETIELSDAFKAQLKRGLTLTILNMVHDAPFDPALDDAFARLDDAHGAGDGPLARVASGANLARQWFDRDRQYVALLRERLDGDIIEVPMLYARDGREVVRRMAEHLRLAR